MKVYKNGMELMKDTGSLTNALMENIGTKSGITAGDTFAELMWTDRKLWVMTWVAPNKKEFMAQRVKTTMKNWESGTEYPVYKDDGSIETEGKVQFFVFRYKNWWRYSDDRRSGGEKVHLSFGEKTGYHDPSF